MKRWSPALTIAVLLMGRAVVATHAGGGTDIPWGEDKAVTQLPPIFRGRAADRLAAEEVARQDAYRKLVERVYGLALDARTDVCDLALASRKVDTSLRSSLRGMKEVGRKYFDDGRVEIAVKITIREVVEVIEKTYEKVEKGDRLVREETFEDVRRENRDKEYVVVGRGALPHSEGLRKVRAMRAAEVDCYERIAARVFGIQIDADTEVVDFVLESDAIRSKVSVALLNGVRFTKYEFMSDGTCRATAQLTIREVVEVLTRTYRRYAEGSKVKIEDIENIETRNRDLMIVEVGQGVVKQETERPVAAEPFEEKKTVIERVLRREIVVEPDAVKE